jgi:hypothetical protein
LSVSAKSVSLSSANLKEHDMTQDTQPGIIQWMGREETEQFIRELKEIARKREETKNAREVEAMASVTVSAESPVLALGL